MTDAYLFGPHEDRAGVVQLAKRLQSVYRFVEFPTRDAVPVRLSASESEVLFRASREHGVSVSTWQAEGICLYAKVRLETYLLVCSLLGLLHWRALDLNPMLIWEDLLVHEEPPACLCAHRDTVQEYALAFENPYICKACREFFRCLGLEFESLAIQDVLDYVVRERSRAARASL